MIDVPLNYATLIGPVARHLLGEPNKSLSSRAQLRFGSRGSVAVEITGSKAGTWHDHERGEGGGVLDLVGRETGQRNGEAVAWLREQGFIGAGEQKLQRRIVAAYDYKDANGGLLFQVVRYDPKDFRQRRPDGKGGWSWNLDGVERVPFRLPELLRAAPHARVFVAEGEKDCLALAERNLVATCNAGGAGKWLDSHSLHLRGRHVVVLPDNDPAGEAHALDVQRKLLGIAASVRLLRLPGLPLKGDISNWLAAGGTAEELERLAADALEWNADSGDVSAAADLDRPPEFTDEALALRFAVRHAGDLRYVAAWSRWLIWDGAVWRFDDTLRAFDMARAICRPASAECNNRKIAAGIASAKTVAAVERLAKADRRHAATVDQWDADPWLLNTPGGVVDLRTGSVRPHRPDDCMTKMAAVAPGGECPLWHQFLARITGAGGELHDFLQRAAGYALTGITREHALFFGYGTGANGKGVLVNTLRTL